MKRVNFYAKYLKTAFVAAGLFSMPFCFGQKTVYSKDFDDLKVGKYTNSQITRAIGDFTSCKGADDGRVFITKVPGHGNVFDVKYPKGGVKTEGSGMTAQWFFNDGKEHEALYFEYDVYIPKDFEWATGGKLPGLGYVSKNPRRNMSLRLMWRQEGLLEFYVHYNTKPTTPSIYCESDPNPKNRKHQASINWSLINPYDCHGGPGNDQVKLKKGAWNHIKMYYKLNTPGKADGIMRGWLNGKLAIDITDNRDMRVKGEEDIKMNCMYFSAFFGTSVPSPIDTYMYFDNLLVTTDGATGGGNGGNDKPNKKPTVSLTAPLNNASYMVGDNIKIKANASDKDGTIDRVEFYSNGNKIGSDDSAPYAYTINSAKKGSYKIKVKAFDNKNLSATSEEIKVTVEGKNNGGGNDKPEDVTACGFGTPANKALKSFGDVTFTKAHVLGKSDFSTNNIKKFRIDYSSSNKKIKRFAINTKNGKPSYYVDLRSKMTAKFGSAKPQITFKGTGIKGLDGSYWVNSHGDNFVMVSKKGDYTIYFSNSAAKPKCGSTKSSILEKVNVDEVASKVSIYPNPVKNQLYIKGIADDEVNVKVVSVLGKVFHNVSMDKDHGKVDVSSLPKGTYVVVITGVKTNTSIPFYKL